MATFGYNLFGLKVNSNLKLTRYEQKKAYAKPDAIIRVGEVQIPEEGLEKTLYKPFTIYNKDIYYLHIPTIAHFLVKEKKEVIIDLYEKKKLRDAITFFEDSLLSILLIQNNIFPLRASAVKDDDGVIVFLSNRGIGKSSLATYLCLKYGYRFITDDKCVLHWDEKKEQYMTRCYYPQVRLWKNMVNMFKGKNKLYPSFRLRPSIEKYSFDMSRKAYKRMAPVKAIYLVIAENEMIDMKTKELKGIDRINAIKSNIHMQQSVKPLQKEKEVFKFAAHLTPKVKVATLHRNNLTTLKEFVNYINNEIHQKTTAGKTR